MFFQVLLLNFITKLEKNQLDTKCHPPAGFSRGLADEIGKSALSVICYYHVVKRAGEASEQAQELLVVSFQGYHQC
jgi:hypothetical protein